MTVEQARRYLASLSAQEQEQVNATLDPENYDAALLAWFEAAVNAGDPRAVAFAGGKEGEGFGEGQAEEGSGGIADWQNAAPYSEWMGKRKPTPRELRRWAHDVGRPEDYQRFDDRQLKAWIDSDWDVEQGGFFAADGTRIDKPTETGGRQAPGAGDAGQGDGGGGGGGAAKPAAPAAPADDGLGDWAQGTNQELQDRLLQIFEEGAGYFDPSKRAGVALEGGGIVWRDPNAPPVPSVPPAQKEIVTGRGGGRGTTGGADPNVPRTPGGGWGLGETLTGAGAGKGAPGAPTGGSATSGVNPALVSATLNAFTPAAPSQQGVSRPASNIPVNPAFTPATATPVTKPQPFNQQYATPATTGTSPLQKALSKQYTQPNQWWTGRQQNYSY